MIPVSQTWRDAITQHRTRVVRNSMRASVYIGVFDESASGDATLTKSGGDTYYSDFSLVNSPDEQEASYATFEGDFFRGDGVQMFAPAPGGNTLRQGWVSGVMSGSAKTFTSNPKVTITFATELHSMIGLTLVFDPYCIPDSFTFTWSAAETQIGTSSVTGNTDAEWIGELNIVNADKIEIEFTKTAAAYDRIHLQTILFGIGYTYGNDQLIDFSLSRTCSPLSLSLPSTQLSFGLFNEGYKYNVDKTSSMIRFLKNDQQVVATMWYNTAATAESVPHWEQIKLCTLWLTSWDVQGSKATFKCVDSFQKLNNIDYKDSDFGNRPLPDRLDDIMAYAGFTNYEFAENAQPCLVMPQASVAQLLQMSANLTMSTLEQDANGKLIIRPRNEPTITSVVPHGSTEDWSVATSVGLADNTTYATFDVNFFTGNGTQMLMGTPYLDNGLTWAQFPSNGSYSGAYVDILLAENSTFGSLNVIFPEAFTPSTYTVQCYRLSGSSYTQVYNRTFDGTQSQIADVFDRIQKITITINGCSLYQRPRLKTVSIGWETGYDITEADIIDRPTGRILTACKDAVADVRTYTAESKQLATADVAAGVSTVIGYSTPATNVTASASAGTVSIVTNHAYYTTVSCTADAKVTLNGESQEVNTTQSVKAINQHGEDLEIDNPLLSTLPTGYLDWVEAYVSRDTEFDCETLGFPELEAGDLIVYKGEPAQIIKHDLTFNGGACRSRFTLRKE